MCIRDSRLSGAHPDLSGRHALLHDRFEEVQAGGRGYDKPAEIDDALSQRGGTESLLCVAEFRTGTSEIGRKEYGFSEKTPA